MPFGKCCICTMAFELDTMSSLKCGHTFHQGCISTWLKAKKDCPKCRKKAIEREIVRLYIDERDHDSSMLENYNAEEMIDQLEKSLLKEKREKAILQAQVDELARQSASLGKELKTASDKAKQLDGKIVRIQALERMLRDQKQLEGELSLAKALVRASEFYKLISKGRGDIEMKELQKYVGRDGQPNMDVFVSILQGDLKKSEEKHLGMMKQLRMENTRYQQEAQRYKALAGSQKQKIENLNRELAHLRGSTSNANHSSSFASDRDGLHSPDFLHVGKSFGFSPDSIRVSPGLLVAEEPSSSMKSPSRRALSPQSSDDPNNTDWDRPRFNFTIDIQTPERVAFNFRIDTPVGEEPTTNRGGLDSNTSFSPEVLFQSHNPSQEFRTPDSFYDDIEIIAVKTPKPSRAIRGHAPQMKEEFDVVETAVGSSGSSSSSGDVDILPGVAKRVMISGNDQAKRRRIA